MYVLCLQFLGADITDYFNFGFTEETWRLYCEKQRKMKSEVGTLNKIAVSSSSQVTLQSKTWYSSYSPSYTSTCALPYLTCLGKASIYNITRQLDMLYTAIVCWYNIYCGYLVLSFDNERCSFYCILLCMLVYGKCITHLHEELQTMHMRHCGAYPNKLVYVQQSMYINNHRAIVPPSTVKGGYMYVHTAMLYMESKSDAGTVILR